MEYKYIIKWVEYSTWEEGYGDFKFYPNELSFANKVAKEMNKKYPEYFHTVVEITPEVLKRLKRQR